MEYQKQEFLDKIKVLNPHLDLEIIAKAYDVAESCHRGQTRASGEPYFNHPVEVAILVSQILHLDTASIATALLHDTVEDTDITIEEIEKIFGSEIASLVNGVTKLTRIEFQPANIRQAENFRKFLIAMSEDIRVLLIKLVDRLHNMRTIEHIVSPDKRQRIATETLEIYAPLAERIGIHQIKTDLQDLSFATLYPRMRESILERLSEVPGIDDNLILKITEEIKNNLQDKGLDAEVSGRKKSPYSIWMKLNQKNLSFDQLSDIVAFRIIVKDLIDCYRALGIIHSIYKMIPESFQDYISTPKHNGYQSLHTLVIGPFQQRIEIQIRTEEMHEIAELGVAAHWAYKQHYKDIDGKKYRWIRELLSVMELSSDSDELMQNTKLAMYYDQVFCFTPQGKLISLPKGSCPIDFAYAIHSKIGHHCSGAKVNGKLVPLRTHLENGDQVDILTSNSQTPSPEWEDFVMSAKAKTEIRKFIRQQRQDQYMILGKNLIEKAAKFSLVELNDKNLLKAAHTLAKKTVEDLYCAVGEGRIGRDEVIKLIKSEKSDKFTDKIVKFFVKKNMEDSDKSSISIEGLIPGMAVHYAKCCNPIPGDKIVGVINTGRGVTVHINDCDNAKNKPNSEVIDLSWSSSSLDSKFIIRLRVVISNESGSLASLTSEFAKYNTNITNIKITNRNPDYFEFILDAEIGDISKLQPILSSLRSKKMVQHIERYKD